jgi:hypothetical protein
MAAEQRTRGALRGHAAGSTFHGRNRNISGQPQHCKDCCATRQALRLTDGYRRSDAQCEERTRRQHEGSSLRLSPCARTSLWPQLRQPPLYTHARGERRRTCGGIACSIVRGGCGTFGSIDIAPLLSEGILALRFLRLARDLCDWARDDTMARAPTPRCD